MSGAGKVFPVGVRYLSEAVNAVVVIFIKVIGEYELGVVIVELEAAIGKKGLINLILFSDNSSTFNLIASE